MQIHAGSRAGVAMGFAGLVLSAFFMLGVHVVGVGQVDAVGSPLSVLVFVDGYGWMFGAIVLSMAMGAVGLALVTRRGCRGPCCGWWRCAACWWRCSRPTSPGR